MELADDAFPVIIKRNAAPPHRFSTVTGMFAGNWRQRLPIHPGLHPHSPPCVVEDGDREWGLEQRGMKFLSRSTL